VTRVVKVVLLLMSCVSVSVIYGDTFAEIGDARGLPVTAEVTAGVDTLTAIDGTLRPDFGDVADMFEIVITDGGTFSATTVGGASFDTELFLFDNTGAGVYAQDDVSGLRARSTLPTPPGVYFLAIAPCCFELSNSGLIFDASIDHNAVVSAEKPRGALPTAEYSGVSSQSTGMSAYTIPLTGAQFSAPVSAVLELPVSAAPELWTLVLLLTGVAAIIGLQFEERRRS